MGITLYFSNQLMPLADKLRANLYPEGGRDNEILDPPVVIVPNMNLSKWIKLTLAEKTGIYMNVNFTYMESGLWEMLQCLDARSPAESGLLDKNGLAILIFFILMNLDRDIPQLRPIERYLRQTYQTDSNDWEIRSWQLAVELALLFEEYEYHRAEMIQDWMADRSINDAMEACQKWIYREMLALKDQLGRAMGKRLGTIAQYAREVLGSVGKAHEVSQCPLARIHFFGLSQISPIHLQLLHKLGATFDIHLYSLNPSQEYWEDIKTPSEKRWIQHRAVDRLAISESEALAGDLSTTPDHVLLSAWGKPGRESIRLLCQLTDYDFQAGFSDSPKPDTVLGAIANSLLTLDNRGGLSQPLIQDRSLQIMGCPGIRREVETVYDSILHNLASDPALNMTDIAVMVSDMSRYKPVVESIFSRHPARLNYNLVDSLACTESVVAQAVLSLMELAKGDFSRNQVFNLLRSPCVMQRWDYGSDTLAAWIGWADALGIFHGYENEAYKDEDSPRAGCYSWRQGVERMRLSRIMTTPVSVGDMTLPHFKGLVPFADINTSNDRLLETFCRLVETLATSIRKLQMDSASAKKWRDTFFYVLDQFIAIPTDMRGEETVYQSLVRAFDHFVHYDTLCAVRPGRALTADALWSFVGGHLKGITGGQGDYLTGGVTVSGLMPMRPIPFKVVYVLGLEEGRFPGRSTHSLFDLRNRKRRIGDITPAERNRYLFLEILISVRHRLYLSYVSRDLQKDRELAPCSVLHQLRRYVEQHILGGRSFQISRIPIKADDSAYIAPDAVNVWSDVMAGGSVIRRISSYHRNGLWEAFVKRASAEELASISRYDPQFSSADRSPDDEGMLVALTIDRLRRFLLDPVATAAKFHLGVSGLAEPATDPAEMADEPFASQFPVDFEIRTAPVNRWLSMLFADAREIASAASLEWEFEAVYADLYRKSRVPFGAFAEHDKTSLKETVLAVGDHLQPLIEQMRSARQLFTSVMMGAATQQTTASTNRTLNLGPMTIEIPRSEINTRPTTVQLNGWLPWVWQDDDFTWHCLTVTGSNRKSMIADKYVIGPALGCMAMVAGGGKHPWSDADRITIHSVYQSHILSLDYPLEANYCAAYLVTLLEEFLNPWPNLWLPFETISGRTAWRSLVIEEAITDGMREEFCQSLTEAMNQSVTAYAELVGAEVTLDSLDHARKRFRALLV